MIAAIILAAGRSRRMGTNKLFLPFGQTTVIEHIARRITESQIDKTYLVASYEKDRLTECLKKYPVTIVRNPDPDSEMLDSIRCALEVLPSKCKAVLIALGDQPALTTELVNRIIQIFGSTQKTIIVPTYSNKRGHPIMISTTYCNEIMKNFDNTGLRTLLTIHPEAVYELEVSQEWILTDMDYPEDYMKQLSDFNNQQSFP